MEAIPQWEADCRGELTVNHENEAFLKFVLLAGILGYKHAAFGLEYPTSVAEPGFTFYANYAPDWQMLFVERHARHHGSKVAHGKRTAQADIGAGSGYYWSRSDFRREAECNNITLDRLETGAGPSGTSYLVGLAGVPKPTDEADKMTTILIDQTIARMTELLILKNLPQAAIELSHSERAYLRWVLDGKTAGEIADIVQLPLSQVERMQRKLPERFDKRGISATAFLAYRIGMLDD